MTAGALIELQANLRALNLAHMARNLESPLRQARERGIGYDEFLIELTAAELQARAENRLARRTREAKFPLVKLLRSELYRSRYGIDDGRWQAEKDLYNQDIQKLIVRKESAHAQRPVFVR